MTIEGAIKAFNLVFWVGLILIMSHVHYGFAWVLWGILIAAVIFGAMLLAEAIYRDIKKTECDSGEQLHAPPTEPEPADAQMDPFPRYVAKSTGERPTEWSL